MYLLWNDMKFSWNKYYCESLIKQITIGFFWYNFFYSFITIAAIKPDRSKKLELQPQKVFLHLPLHSPRLTPFSNSPVLSRCSSANHGSASPQKANSLQPNHKSRRKNRRKKHSQINEMSLSQESLVEQVKSRVNELEAQAVALLSNHNWPFFFYNCLYHYKKNSSIN